MSLSISKSANENYLAKVVRVDKFREHLDPEVSRLKVASIDYQDVIVSIDQKDGDILVFFPLECQIDLGFLSSINAFRDPKLNEDKEKKGYFDKKGRVKATRLRGEKSMGFLVPCSQVFDYYGVKFKEEYVGTEFDTIGSSQLLKKYIVPRKELDRSKGGKDVSPNLSRLVDGQVNLHVSTANIRKNIERFNPEDNVTITYKTHGTSWWVSNVLTKKRLSLKGKIANFFGVSVVDKEYSIIYGSRRVVKNKKFEDPKNKDHFYGYDLWKEIKDHITEKCDIPQGFTLYGECIGYTKEGGYIQKDYDYSIPVGQFRVEVYRITNTTPNGLVTELSYDQIKEFCSKVDLTPSELFYSGKASGIGGLYKEGMDLGEWRDSLMKHLEGNYIEKDCHVCSNKVPEEGVVIRREKLLTCDSYKLKSFRFLEKETKDLDKGVENLEDSN